MKIVPHEIGKLNLNCFARVKKFSSFEPPTIVMNLTRKKNTSKYHFNYVQNNIKHVY